MDWKPFWASWLLVGLETEYLKQVFPSRWHGYPDRNKQL